MELAERVAVTRTHPSPFAILLLNCPVFPDLLPFSGHVQVDGLRSEKNYAAVAAQISVCQILSSNLY
jgi:hypothetical protein